MAATDLVLDEEVANKVELPDGLLANLEEKNRMLAQLRAPIDNRIESFLEAEFIDCKLTSRMRLPSTSLVLDRHGLARQLSLPDGSDEHRNAWVSSYRLANGVLHNPPKTVGRLWEHFMWLKVGYLFLLINELSLKPSSPRCSRQLLKRLML